MLPAIEIETGPKPTATVIWLHGLGDDGNGWSQVVPSLGLPSRLAIRFLFPHAPMMPVSINNGYVMRAWYDIREANLNERADLDGVRRSQAAVEAMIAHEKARGIAASRIVLAGFSQGGAIALYAGLRHRERLAGIVALSTYLIDAPALEAEAAPANRDVPIFMAHGTLDPVVRIAWAEQSRQALVAAGWHVEWNAYPMEHSAVLEEIVAVSAFLQRVLPTDAGAPRARRRAGDAPRGRSLVRAVGFVLDRHPGARPHAAPRQRIAQQELDLRVRAAQIRLREALDLGPESGIDAQQEGLLGGHGGGVRNAAVRARGESGASSRRSRRRAAPRTPPAA